MRKVIGNAVYIITDHRFGDTLVTGTVTGNSYIIGRNGAWVHVDDEQDVLSRVMHAPCCVDGVTVFAHGNPSQEQMGKPSWFEYDNIEVLKTSDVPVLRPARKTRRVG